MFKRIRLNFRKSKSDRTATDSYRAYHQRLTRVIKKIIPRRGKTWQE